MMMFAIGLIVGGVVGVVLMAVLIAGRDYA